jgi:predicted aspartyl protease
MRVNGHGPYDFVLDTGSSNSSVDRSLVRRLDLPRTGQLHPVQGVTGSGVVPVVRVHRWTLGGVPMHGTSLSVVDLGIGVGGLLGSDELCRFGDVILDFRHNRLIIQPR